MQFIHELPEPDYPELRRRRVNGKTVAIQSLTDPQNFTQIINDFISGRTCVLILKVGVANCYHKDQFKKKTGREVALAKMEYRNFRIEKVRADEKDIRIKLICKDIDLTLTLKHYKDSKKIRTFLHNKLDLWVC